MRRQPGRFVAAVVLLALIATLLMLLGGLLDGLIRQATGAIEAQRADLVVFSDTAERSLLRSRITPEVREQVAAVDGVTSVGGLGGDPTRGAGARERAPRPHRRRGVRISDRTRRCAEPACRGRGLRRSIARARRRVAGRRPAGRTGAVGAEGRRLRRRHELLRSRSPVGGARDVARDPEREPSCVGRRSRRVPGAGRARPTAMPRPWPAGSNARDGRRCRSRLGGGRRRMRSAAWSSSVPCSTRSSA